MCKSVCVWNIWADVKLLFGLHFSCDFLSVNFIFVRFILSFAHGISVLSVFFVYLSRGVRHDCGTALNEATTIMGYWVWSTQRTCIYFVCKWHPAKPRTGETISVFWMFLHGCRNLEFIFSQNWDLNRLIQVFEVSSYLFLRNDIWSLWGTCASTAWVPSISC